MCLMVDPAKTKELRNSGKEFVIRYKVLTSITGRVTSYFQSYVWKKGWNIAEGEPGEFDITKGAIHVYVDKEEAEWLADAAVGFGAWSDGYAFVAEVKCHIEDLIAVGTFKVVDVKNIANIAPGTLGGFRYQPTEAYKKVYLDELPPFNGKGQNI